MNNETKSHKELIHSYLDILAREIDQALNTTEDTAKVKELEKQISTLKRQNEDQHKTIEADAETLEEYAKERIKLHFRIKELEKKTTHLENALIAEQEVNQWHTASQPPADGTRVIIRTKPDEAKGQPSATFMFEPIGGKFPDWVEKWMYIPQ